MIDDPEPHPITQHEAELLDMMARKIDAASKRHNGVWHNEPRRERDEETS